MTPLEIYADLGGTREVADALGVTTYRVRRWLERRSVIGCPPPVRQLASGYVYSIAEWRGWFAIWVITHRARPKQKTTP